MRRAASFPLHVLPVDARVGVNDGRWQSPRSLLPATPTVGAGSSQRVDFPAPPLRG